MWVLQRMRVGIYDSDIDREGGGWMEAMIGIDITGIYTLIVGFRVGV